MKNFSSKGFFYEKKFLNDDLLKKTQSFFDSHIEIESTNTTTKKFNYIDLDQFAILESLHKEILKYVKKNIKINCVLRNIWMQKSFYSIENKGLPYIPHIDKKRYFKIFLYLNDIEINNGPFTVSTNSSVKENEKLRKQMASSQEAHLSEFGQRLENDVNLAKQAYKQAHDEGDVDRMFEAQQALSRISIDQERHRLGVKRQEEQAQQPQPEPEPQPQVVPDPKAVAWAEKNEWFGQDERMTREAMRINEDLTQYEGFDATSDEYYDEINKRIQDRFPDYFKKTGRSTKVAPADTSASRKPSGRSSVKLTHSEVETAKKLNVTLEQYAKEKARLMARDN